MSLRYHACGQPIVMHEERHGSYTARFYEASDEAAVRITTCPRCGDHLAPTVVTTERPTPERTLAHWLLLWPDLQAVLEERLAQCARSDPHVYPYHAQQGLVDFERQLEAVATLAEDLAAVDEGSPGVAQVS